VAVIVERPAGHEDPQVGADLLAREPGHVAAEVVGVGADVAEAAGGTAPGGIGAPGRLLLPLALEPRPQPPLDVFGPDRLDFAELAPEDHRPGLADERVAGVVVGDHEHRSRAVHQPRELLRLGERERERLVAHDVKARREGRLGDREVHVVGGRDRHEVDPFSRGQRGFPGEHLVVGAVGPLRRHGVVGGAGPGAFGVAREGAGYQGGPVVEHGGGHVNAADERSLPASHEPHPQFPAERTVGRHRRLP